MTATANLGQRAAAAQALADGATIRTIKVATSAVQAKAEVVAEVAAIHLFMSTREKIAGAMAAMGTAIREAAVRVASAVAVILEATGDMEGTVVQILTPAAVVGLAVVTWVAALSRSLLLGLPASQWPGSL